ncbi:uncharacterized protein LOC132925053 [Rhopalosiphum padi]|uniref:uncharacterized protein LOC132925053 n=1 Tax=Rhopalosiphum padi TaxID=40932 RepID=UPI00298DE255|nr:uncharacterized protein LOC132925053 [Rhopalosiphum padi]
MFITKQYILSVWLMAFVVILLITSGQGKDHRCHRPVTKNCNASESYIEGWKFTGWYYHTELRACRPLYTPNGWHTCTENYELPIARQMCEDLCAEPCTRTNGAPGICMYNEICKMSYSVKPPIPNPCDSNRLTCCARGRDNDLTAFPGLVYENGQIVFRAILKNFYDPGYEQEGFTYIYFLPYSLNDESRRFK